MAGTEFLLLFPTHFYGVFFFQFFLKPPLAVSRSALKKDQAVHAPLKTGQYALSERQRVFFLFDFYLIFLF
jgi:hypothetical protein